MESNTPEIEAAAFSTAHSRLEELAAQSDHLALIVAQNVAAPRKLLQQLALSEDLAIQIEVVKNPNTPEETLWKLGARFPRELLVNPIFDLLLLANLNLL